jgi:hypothetical protein
VAASALAGCDQDHGSTVEPVRPPYPVVVVGDSLSAQSIDRIAELLPTATIDAVPGRTMVVPFVSDTAISHVEDLKAANPGARWIVELGTNDSGFGAHTAEQLQAELDLLLAAIGRDTCIAWVLPAVRSPRSAEEIARVEAFAARLRAEISSLPCGEVLDWPAVIAAEPDLLGSDGVHLTDDGEQALAELLASGAT